MTRINDLTDISLLASKFGFNCIAHKVADDLKLAITDKDTGKEGIITLSNYFINPPTVEELSGIFDCSKQRLDVLA